MTDPDDTARRILKLEELSANQAAEIDKLSEQVRQQWTRIDQLTQSLLHLRDRLIEVEDGAANPHPVTRPPHY